MNNVIPITRGSKRTKNSLTVLRAESTATACVSYLVQSDIISPIKARVGQIIVCNPNSSLQALTVIVKESRGRIVGTLTRTSVSDAVQQLDALAASGALSLVDATQATSEVQG